MSHLHCSPKQRIRFADTRIKDIDVVAADRRDVDFLVILKATGKRQRPVISLSGFLPAPLFSVGTKLLPSCAVRDSKNQMTAVGPLKALPKTLRILALTPKPFIAKES